MILTQDGLKALLTYTSETGEFVWNVRASSRVRVGSVAGCVKADGYVAITINKRAYKAHRLAWLYVYGEWPRIIDHIDRDKTNNRLSNLREATRSENAFNRGLFRNNKSGVVGVFWYEKLQKWQASITINGIVLYLGRFEKFQDAVAARKAAEKRYNIDLEVKGFALPELVEVATTA